MSSPRKSLKERIIGTSPEEPPVVIAPADPHQARADAAREGILAVENLVKERNDAIKRADLAERRVEYLVNANNNERARADYWQRERDQFMQLTAQLGVLVTQQCDLSNHIYQLLAQNAALVQRASPPPKITNNPGAPAVVEDAGPQFDDNGIPYNSAPLSPTPEELKQVIERLGTNGGVQ
jgi:hypothetical protein